MTESTNLYEAFEKGAEDFIRKPIDKLEFVARVKSILKMQEYQNQIVERKNNELALHAMYLLENKEKQLRFFKDLKEIIKKLSLGKKQVLNFIEKITNNMLGDLRRDTWKDFEFYFNQIHPDFTKSLSEKYTSLTPSEIRLCVFLRMNMNTQSIADVLHITTDSIKTSRTRLRTKLNLDRKTNLTTFISSI